MKWFCSTPMIPTRRYALDTRLAPNTVVLWLTTSTARCLFTSIRSSRRTVQSMASARPWNELQMTYRKPRSDTCGTDPSKTVAAPDTRTPTGTLTTRHGRRLTRRTTPSTLSAFVHTKRRERSWQRYRTASDDRSARPRSSHPLATWSRRV
jgi:hypothetical protein